MNESAQSALKKISFALSNLKVSKEATPLVSNYIHNLVLTILRDDEVRKRLNEEPEKLLEELSKI